MKMRFWSFLSLAAGYAFLTSASGFVGGCGGSSSGGSTGTGGSGTTFPPEQLISDFEDLAGATVTMAGAPPRNGYWYTYNDWAASGPDAATCRSVPNSKPYTDASSLPQELYVGVAPPTSHPNASGSLALRAKWDGCSVWGAGVGADLNQPAAADGGVYTGPKVPYDVGQFTGVPPTDVVVFEVARALDCENDSGNIDADFASGDFQIACPVVVFSLLNNPTGAKA